jgi:hypothetical protein
LYWLELIGLGRALGTTLIRIIACCLRFNGAIRGWHAYTSHQSHIPRWLQKLMQHLFSFNTRWRKMGIDIDNEFTYYGIPDVLLL